MKGPYLDVVGDDGDVLEVKGGVDLVHDVQRRGLVVVQREDQGQGRERLLAAGQVGDVLPRLLGRADREDDALAERVQRIHQLQLPCRFLRRMRVWVGRCTSICG